MPARIDIELTSAAADGSWTWRAAGARQPRGVLDGSILPGTPAVGDQLRVETEQDVDGIRVVSVVPGKEKSGRQDLLELLPAEETFEPVVQHRAPGGGGGSGGRGDRGPRRPRRDGPDGERRDRAARGPRADRGDRSDRSDRPDRDRRPGSSDRPEGGEDRRRHRPHFTPPPEVPQRPKPKRLRPGKLHRTELLAALADEQRPIAELVSQGMAAVRQRLREDNARLRAEGKPEMPDAAVMKMAEELLPRMRVADWLDRAEAAQRQLEHLDLRDLRSVVAAADDPVVARDESTRALAVELKQALVTKQDEELTLWLADVEAALDVGRVVRALRLSSVPPKAGVPFPPALARRLAEATTASLQPTDGPDRWAAVLEAAAFSPVRSLVVPAAPSEQRSDELMGTVRRLGPLLPQIAALYEVEVRKGAPAPKPLRPTNRRPETSKAAARPGAGPRRERPPRPPETPAAAEAEAPAAVEATPEPAELTPDLAPEPSDVAPVAAPDPADAPPEPEQAAPESVEVAPVAAPEPSDVAPVAAPEPSDLAPEAAPEPSDVAVDPEQAAPEAVEVTVEPAVDATPDPAGAVSEPPFADDAATEISPTTDPPD